MGTTHAMQDEQFMARETNAALELLRGPVFVMTDDQFLALQGLMLRMSALAYIFSSAGDISALSIDELQALFDEPVAVLKATIAHMLANSPVYSVVRREDSRSC